MQGLSEMELSELAEVGAVKSAGASSLIVLQDITFSIMLRGDWGSNQILAVSPL